MRDVRYFGGGDACEKEFSRFPSNVTSHVYHVQRPSRDNPEEYNDCSLVNIRSDNLIHHVLQPDDTFSVFKDTSEDYTDSETTTDLDSQETCYSEKFDLNESDSDPDPALIWP